MDQPISQPVLAAIPACQTGAALRAAYAKAGIQPGSLDFFQTPEWFANLAETCLAPGERPALLAAAGAVLPLRTRCRRMGPLWGREARGLANFYSCRFAPPGLTASPSGEEAAQTFGRALRRSGHAVLHFDALDEADCRAMAAGLARSGWLTEPFPQFGNWYLDTGGLSFQRYWAGRPGRLRSTGERRRRALFSGEAGAAVVRYAKPAEAPLTIGAYAHVSGRSWQKDEPFPAFLPGLIRYGFRKGEVEVWVLTVQGAPAAVQIWVRRHRRATIFKLAFDQAWRRQSVGTVLTMCAMEAALEGGGVDRIDFGWGDDPYKRDWLPYRGQRYGLAAYNIRTPLGAAMAVRNLAPRWFRRRMAPHPNAGQASG